jgi:ferric-dicitrate binding protein FerR (iron transport regulator)
VTLRDGSRVILGPQTTLTVDGDFDRRTRTVRLSGEAYFDVRVVRNAPFVVRTGAVTTRVLGTSFTVSHYATDSATQLSVYSGRVEIGGRRSTMTLGAGMTARVTDSTAVLSRPNETKISTDWTTDRLIFERAPVAAVLQTLGRWYGYEFQLADSTLAAQKISAEFKGSDRQEMMVILKGALDVDLRFNGRVVTLVSRSNAGHAAKRRDGLKPSLEMGK